MSTLTDFISKLSMRIQKPAVKKDLEATIKELNEYTLPMASEMAKQYSVVPFSSDYANAFSSQIRDQVKFAGRSENIWQNLSDALVRVQANAVTLEKLVNEYLQEDTLRDGITARAAQLLRMAGVISFISSYTLEAADFTLSEEAAKLGGESNTAPAQRKHMMDSLLRYARSLADASIDPKKFEKMFDDIPSVYVSTGNESQIASMFSARSLDPFSNVGMISGWTGSPIYNIRMSWETYWAERHHSNKDRRAQLALRLIHLQNMQNKEQNPRIEKEIEGLEARIRRYDQKIRAVEATLV